MSIDNFIKNLPFRNPAIDEFEDTVVFDYRDHAIKNGINPKTLGNIYGKVLAEKIDMEAKYKDLIQKSSAIKAILEPFEAWLIDNPECIGKTIAIKEYNHYAINELILDDEYKISTTIKQINLPKIKDACAIIEGVSIVKKKKIAPAI